MTDRDKAVRDIQAAFCASDFPDGFLAKYDQLECLASHRGVDTFLVCEKNTARLFVAKCYDTALYAGVQESGILGSLRHAGLPLFAEAFHNEKMVCIIRAYIEGTPLDRYAQEHALTREQVLSICVQLSDILMYLHAQTPPVIHRDIKPQNIIVREDATIALIDFDAARILKEEAGADTQLLGTKGYAPPEQYGFSQTDRRSDIFSLGMVLGFLLTGGAELEQVQSCVGDRGLRRIVNRCTAFSPKERYPSAAKVKQALLRQRPKAKRARGILLAGAGLLAVGVCVMIGLCADKSADADGVGVAESVAAHPAGEAIQTGFAEPLIEQAVRAVLHKGETEEITPGELASVTELYVFGTVVSDHQDAFYASASDFYAGRQTHGGISSIEDIRLLPNLRILCLAAQQISDISPLAALPGIEKVELKHNLISDIGVLPALKKLSSVGINDNPVADMSPLAACSSLRFLDLCDVRGYDPAFLDDMGDFAFLDIANDTQSYAHLGSRSIKQLKIGYSGFDSLTYLSEVTGLTSLEVKHSALTSLAGIEAHAALTYLNIAGCAIDNLSPVLALPALQTLVISEDMQPLVSALGNVTFDVEIE
ncbi:MAG: protein kinase [Clostridia bacterium]|nr:protein kinase [Clostridia bacterium]